MEHNPPKKARTSMRIKLASVFGLMVLAVAFFASPLTTFARSHVSHLGRPGSGAFPFNNPQLRRSLRGGNNNGNDPSDSNNNGNDPSNSNNNLCGLFPFDITALQQQLQKFLGGICIDQGNDPSDSNNPSDSNSPFDVTAFQQQLQKFLQGICTDIGNNNCDPSNGNTIKNAGNITNPDLFKVIGEFEQSGQPLAAKGPSSQAKITIARVKNLKDLQKGNFIAGNDSKGNTFTGEIISPNQSATKQAIGLINGQGKAQIVNLTL